MFIDGYSDDPEYDFSCARCANITITCINRWIYNYELRVTLCMNCMLHVYKLLGPKEPKDNNYVANIEYI